MPSSCPGMGVFLAFRMSFEKEFYVFVFVCAVSLLLHGFSLAAGSGGYAPDAVSERVLWSTGSRACPLPWFWCMGSVAVAPRLRSTISIVVAHGLRGSAACGILQDRGLNRVSWLQVIGYQISI